jgi:alkanesulfonate monooxygenase SsuD/methylene tetrahydromethanopterin reductase-like flavin-dependent oxidoreductase (luciferase family)
VAAAAWGICWLVGTPVQIADVLERWFRPARPTASTSCRPSFPASSIAFVDGVVPILQERGLFRADYAGTTCAITSA